MKLWLLRKREDLGRDDPWGREYDTACGFVIRAKTEAQAREFAQALGGDERDKFVGRKLVEVPAWTDPKYSTCEVLSAQGKAGVILRDFNAA